MYKQGYYKITYNERLTANVYKMKLKGDVQYITAPGQFINIKIDELFLRRPISVCDVVGDEITIIYKVVGKGTERLAGMQEGAFLDVLTGLGNGFNTEFSGEKPLLVGGGVGVPPMFYLAKQLIKEGKEVTAVLGFNKAEEVFYKEEFEKLGVKTVITTVDGSAGIKGFVTDGFKWGEHTHVYTCGPLPMLKAVHAACEGVGSYSFEERMGCGFGACVGCTCKTKYGNKRICKDGPVLDGGEIIW